MTTRHLTAALVASALLVAAGCDRSGPAAVASTTDTPAPSPTTGSDGDVERPCELVESGVGPAGEVAVRAEEVASGLEVPWGLLFMGDGEMLVTERPGRLRLVRDGKLVERPVATIDVGARGEGGLLGIAPHPDFESNRRFFLYMTEGGENRVETWELTGTGAELSARKVGTLIDGIPVARYHNGGRLRIGPDGMLYIGTGDSGDPDLAQDPTSLAGKLLRISPDGSVPADNPFAGPQYLIGIRNTQGFDWRDDGAMYVTDHGPSGELGRRGHDEVTVARAGQNLGWPPIYSCEEKAGMLRPSLTWDQAVPPGGAAIYTGSAIDAWRGSLMVGSLGARHLHRVVFEPGTAKVARHEAYFRGDPPQGLGRLRDTIMGPDGHLYVTTSNCDGRGTCPPDGDKIYRIVPE